MKARILRSIHTCSILFLVLALAAVSASAEIETEAPARDVPADWWQSVQEEIIRSEYEISWQERTLPPDLAAAFQAPNRAHDLRTYFTQEGVRVIPRTGDAGDWQWGLEQTRYGYAGRMLRPTSAELVHDGNRMEYRRGDLLEWYLNDDRGLEQGFTLSFPPGSGDAQDELRIQLRIVGDLIGTLFHDRDVIEFKTADGITVLQYGELSACDADGKALPCRYELEGTQLALLVDDREAEYPVHIDPLASNPLWTAESNQEESGFGFSVATAGDVDGDGYSDIIVGAHNYDSGDTDEGRVRLYLGSPTGPISHGWSQDGNEYEGNLGCSVATAGDVNCDGYADVVVGMPGYTEVYGGEGAVFVYHGSPTGPSSTPSWYARGDWSGYGLGTMVATAGTPGGGECSGILTTTATAHGIILLWSGGSSGLGPTGMPDNCDWLADIDTPNPVVVCSAGDVNGDGYSDILAAGKYFSNDQTSEGGAFIWFGPLVSDGTVDNADWRYETNVDNWYFGKAAATAGDVNGDGYADIIIGSGLSNPQNAEGAAFVFHGSASGPGATPDWMVESNLADHHLGESVSTLGDVNGDGFAEVAVGAAEFSESNPTNNTAGAAYVYFGSHFGLDTDPGWSETGAMDEAYGQCVAAGGDVNGDGYADLLVGAPGYSGDIDYQGRVYLYLGSPAGLAWSEGWTHQGPADYAQYGHSVGTAGDVDGDGYDDVIVGADQYDGGGISTGKVWLYNGSSTGLSDTASWSVQGSQDFEFLGCSVASAGDINNDGYSDVIVGAEGHNGYHHTDAGRALVYHGSPGGLSGIHDWHAVGGAINAFLGCDVATAGDINGDGFSDIIVGARGYEDGESDEGHAFVWHGSSMGLGPTGHPSNADWHAEADQDGASFGAAVSTAGDVNGDGYSDIIVGAPDYRNGEDYEGMAFLWLGSGAGLGWPGNPVFVDWSAESNQADAAFGSAVATAGDVNGDGFADVAIGAPAYSENHSYEGGIFLWYGAETGMGVGGTPLNADWTQFGGQTGSRYGSSVSIAGDVNGDGYADIVVGAPGFDNVGSDEGLALCYQGSETGLSLKWFGIGAGDESNFGCAVASAGDVNGDGCAEIIVGEEKFSGSLSEQGQARLYYGNGGRGKALRPNQRQSSNLYPIAHLGMSNSENSFRLSALGRSPFGRGKVKLEWEVKPLSVLLDGTGLEQSVDWTDSGTSGAILNHLVTNLDSGEVYHWRVRTVYHPAGSPFQRYGRWFTRPWNGWQEADLRMLSDGVGVEETPTTGFELFQNVPNPFNPSTRIAFSIPDTGVDRIDATMSIYDASGRRVDGLPLVDLSPGQHEVIWDGRDSAGQPVPSGVYFYRIEAGGFRSVKKMLLLK